MNIARSRSFVGQFIRRGKMERNVGDVFGVVGDVTYDAFFVSSEQHGETTPDDLVDGPSICEMFKSRGFRLCQTNLEPYVTLNEFSLVFCFANDLVTFNNVSIFLALPNVQLPLSKVY